MDISSFLAVIIFCCLLFLEYDPERRAAYKKLKMNLINLHKSLEDLQYDIAEARLEAELPSTEVIVDRIANIMTEVNRAIEDLRQKTVQEVDKDIDIKEPANKVQASIAHFYQSGKYDSDKLNGLLNKIEKIWKGEDPIRGIQPDVNEAMKRALATFKPGYK